MPVTKAQLASKKKYESKAYWKPTIRFKKDLEATIRKYAKDSVNDFVVSAVMEKLKKLEQSEK